MTVFFILDITGVLIESELIVQRHSKVFKMVSYFHFLVTDEIGVLSWGGTYYELFGLWHIEVEMHIFTPPSEVCDGVVIVQNRVLVCKQGKDGCVIWLSKACGGEWWEEFHVDW